MEKIKKCPFCDQLPKVVHEEPMEKRLFNGKADMTEEKYYVKCRGKGHKVLTYAKTREAAIKFWNEGIIEK